MTEHNLSSDDTYFAIQVSDVKLGNYIAKLPDAQKETEVT